MRIPFIFTMIAVVIGVGVLLLAGQMILQPNEALITEAYFVEDVITPNADGDSDITIFHYEISRDAKVSVVFIAENQTEFIFRDQQPRVANPYSFEFSGVVDGFTLDTDEIVGAIERRLLPEGVYTWRIVAEEIDNGEQEMREGQLTIQDADVPLPIISTFEVGPTVFTPNQDSISDRVEINVFLEKESDLRVFLVSETGQEIPISARKECRKAGEAGRHCFDYEGGIDLGADPPPDGTYTIVATAQDAVGQRVRREAELTIQDGGKPRAEILSQNVGVDVVFDVQEYDTRFYSVDGEQGDLIELPDRIGSLALTPITMQLGNMLVFKLTIENYSDVPIRTTGPPPGTVYEQNQLASTLGWFEESGAWRVGIHCETAGIDFPWRWAIGTDENLVKVMNPRNDTVYSYLPAGERSVVWGAIHLTEIEERNNPQDCWAALIHEDVAISLRNNNVGRREIELIETN